MIIGAPGTTPVPATTRIVCADACGATVDSEDEATLKGWTWLSTQGRYRCGACAGALFRAAKMTGRPPDTTFVDKVPPESRGSLPKETAGTIQPPSLRG